LKTLAFLAVLQYNFLMENRENQTSSTEKMVTISRAEYEQLQQGKARMESTRVRLEAERIKLEAEHARLEACHPRTGVGPSHNQPYIAE